MPNTDLYEREHSNTELLAEALSILLNKTHVDVAIPMSEKEKIKAAYALNLCTVSVSQIIDYNDVNFMEREYEAILNNLNLEEMPKDEALLHILKQLLDVVSFFRIQEGEKKLLEKEYQQKMKNAIWNAVPKIGLIPVGGNPVTTVISLASQVGIGYMNYRKEKAKIGLEQERKEWELQRSAMEQFHGLRRELFDTAWRLADKYNFKESYRLTERQITQFNRILMDADDLRRYERLDYIKNNFIAYPPFWYYLGSTANSVYQNEEMYDDELRNSYKELAIDAFKKFLDQTENNLLREDQLEASCALEYVDLIDDNEEKKKYLQRARKASGNAYDVLELCAMAYLKIREYQDAAELFRVLVNEDYNTTVNAQLLSGILSGIYGSLALSQEMERSEIEKRYRILQSRVGDEHLYPLPLAESQMQTSNNQFLTNQRNNLKQRYVFALSDFATKYSEAYKKICTADGVILNEMVEMLDQMCKAIQTIVPDERYFTIPLQQELGKKSSEFNTMLSYDGPGARRPMVLKFTSIASDPFEKLALEIEERINKMDNMGLISVAEAELDQFCVDNNLRSMPSADPAQKAIAGKNPISDVLFGNEYTRLQKKTAELEACLKIVKDFLNSRGVINGNSQKANVHFYCRDDNYFDSYIKKNEKPLQDLYHMWGSMSAICWRSDKRYTQSDVIAILNDRSMRDRDLIMSTDSVALFEKKKFRGAVLYSKAITCQKNCGISFGKTVYKNDAIDIDALCELFARLAAVQEQNKPSESDDSIGSIIFNIQKAIHVSSSPAPIASIQEKVSYTPVHVCRLQVEKVLDYYQGKYKVQAYAPVEPLRVNGICQLMQSGILKEQKYIVEKIDTGNEEVEEIGCQMRAIFYLVPCADE